MQASSPSESPIAENLLEVPRNMIGPIGIEFDGRRYELTFDGDAPTEACWQWHHIHSSLTTETALAQRLTRDLIEHHAASIAEDLDAHELSCFREVLLAIGATTSDLERPGIAQDVRLRDERRLTDGRFEVAAPSSYSIFNCREIRDWAFSTSDIRWSIPKLITCIGSGPFDRNELISFLETHDVNAFPNELARQIDADIHIEDCILGRNAWNQQEIDDLIDRHEGRSLRIYSQEMFLQGLIAQRDPFAANSSVLAAFRAGHNGLRSVSQGWSGWVTTVVDPAQRRRSAKSTVAESWQEESPLKARGYQVGKNGLYVNERRRILDLVFSDALPIVGPPEYMAKWGDPRSATRLKQMATNIATSAQIARRKAGDYKEAIQDWESDLEWLRETYYRGHFMFLWPDTTV